MTSAPSNLSTFDLDKADVDLPRLIAGLHELSKAFVSGAQGRYGMRIPAEPYHDGDLVCGQAARMLGLFSEQWVRRFQEVERLRAALFKYGHHTHPNCYDLRLNEDGSLGERNECLCGFTAARGGPETSSPQIESGVKP